MPSGTVDGKYYENIPTPEDWGKAQAELESLQAHNRELLAALEHDTPQRLRLSHG